MIVYKRTTSIKAKGASIKRPPSSRIRDLTINYTIAQDTESCPQEVNTMEIESPVVQHPSSKAELATGQEADYGAGNPIAKRACNPGTTAKLATGRGGAGKF